MTQPISERLIFRIITKEYFSHHFTGNKSQRFQWKILWENCRESVQCMPIFQFKILLLYFAVTESQFGNFSQTVYCSQNCYEKYKKFNKHLEKKIKTRTFSFFIFLISLCRQTNGTPQIKKQLLYYFSLRKQRDYFSSCLLKLVKLEKQSPQFIYCFHICGNKNIDNLTNNYFFENGVYVCLISG